jgi:hypothetical protein
MDQKLPIGRGNSPACRRRNSRRFSKVADAAAQGGERLTAAIRPRVVTITIRDDTTGHCDVVKSTETQGDIFPQRALASSVDPSRWLTAHPALCNSIAPATAPGLTEAPLFANEEPESPCREPTRLSAAFAGLERNPQASGVRWSEGVVCRQLEEH